jgi:hypothetical protein
MQGGSLMEKWREYRFEVVNRCDQVKSIREGVLVNKIQGRLAIDRGNLVRLRECEFEVVDRHN